MTDERNRDADKQRHSEHPTDDADEPRGGHPATDNDRNPWTREGGDAPDAADIADPDEQL